MYKVNDIVDIEKNVRYLCAGQHRTPRQRREKSLWSISVDDEVNCFILAHNNKWLLPSANSGWSLHICNYKKPGVLGINRFGEDLKIAKFVNKSQAKEWHGYPADYERNINDRPKTEILIDWVDKAFIDKTCMVRIQKGKGCAL